MESCRHEQHISYITCCLILLVTVSFVQGCEGVCVCRWW